MKTVYTTRLPQKCWIYENHQYFLHGADLPKFPCVSPEYENILKAFKIPYKKIVQTKAYFFNPKYEEALEYWNPDAPFEEVKLTLPLYAKTGDDTYLYCEKNYSEVVPTAETIEAAERTEKLVSQEIFNYEKILNDVSLYRLTKKYLSGNAASMCCKLGSYIFYVKDIDMNHDRFKILSLQNSEWVAIFDMNQISPNGYITLEVPKHIAGRVIGKSGTNIQSWARELKVKKINVIPV